VAVGVLAYVVYRNWGSISGYFRTHWTRIRNLFLTGMVIFTPFIAALVWVGAKVYNNWDKISATFSNAWTRIKSGFSEGIEWVKGRWTAFTTWLSGTTLGKAVQWGGDIASGAANGIKKFGAKAMAAAGNMADNVGGNFANQLQIRSPSRVFMAYGGHIASGLAIGLDRSGHHPVHSMRRMATAVVGAGAMSLAPAASAKPALGVHGGLRTAAAESARAPAASRGPIKFEIHIHQQPGENADALADRVIRKIQQATRAKGHDSYGDDF
jgi:phage-related protein